MNQFWAFHECRRCGGRSVGGGTCSGCLAELQANHDLAERIKGACEAMARFLVWVWCEGMARDLASGAYGRASFNTDPDTEWREWAVFRAIDLGLLRLDWGR